MTEGRPPPIHLSAELELPSKAVQGFEFEFEQLVVTLGRDPSNDIQLPVTTVSRHHARILYEQGDYFLEDLGSTYGTLLNQREVGRNEKRLLRSGDQIGVLSFRMTFDVSPDPLVARKPGEGTGRLARRMAKAVVQSLGGSDQERPSVRVMSGEYKGRRFELSGETADYVIGRSSDCDIPLAEGSVSRRHCLLRRGWYGFTLEDLESRNGLRVNGQVVDGSLPLTDGDEVEVGGIRLRFFDPPSRLLERMGGLRRESRRVDADPEANSSHGPSVSVIDKAEHCSVETEPPQPSDDDLGPPLEVADSAPESGDFKDVALPEAERRALAIVPHGLVVDSVVLGIGGLFLLAVATFTIFLFL